MSEHPEIDVLSAYVDGTLDDRDRAAVEAHVAECEACLELVTEVMHVQPDEAETSAVAPGGGVVTPPSETRRRVLPFTRRRWVWAAGVAAAAVFLLVLSIPQGLRVFGTDDGDVEFERLVTAVGTTRTIEGRLSGGFSYGEFRAPVRTPRPDTNLSLLAAAGEIQARVKASPTPRNLHSWGVAQLLLGEYDEAVVALERAASEIPSDTRLSSDLAAAYLARARADRPDDLPRALAVAQTAVAQDPSALEALFNKALAATALNLREEAREAWRAYLVADSSSDWAEEARRQLARLEQSLGETGWPAEREAVLQAAASGATERLSQYARHFGQQMREMVEDDLLPNIGRELGAGEFDRSFDMARGVVAALRVVTSDPFLDDVLEGISRVRESRDSQAEQRLARGFVTYAEARKLYEANHVSKATAAFRRAGLDLSASGNPMAQWCIHYEAIGDYYQGRLTEVIDVQARVARDAEAAGYRILAARAHWMLGLARGVQGDHDAQLAHYRRALQPFVEAGERQNEAAIHNLIAGSYLYLGEHRLAWRHAVAALAEIDASTAPRRQHTQLASATNAAIRLGLSSAAVVMAAETRRAAYRWGAPEAILEALHYEARAFMASGRESEALTATRQARPVLERVPDPGLRARLSAELDQTEAEVMRSLDPPRAAAAAARALSFFESRGPLLRVPRLHLAQARALVEQSDRTAAKEAYRLAIRRFEAERATLPSDGDLRLSHFDDVWNAYRELLELAVADGGEPAELFALADRGRARSLSERLRLEDGLYPSRVQSAIPARTVVVFFAVLSDRTLAWTLSRRGIRVTQIAVSRRALADRIRQYVWQLRWNSQLDEWRVHAAALHDLLIRPLALASDEVEALVIIPDGGLHAVPFAALWNAHAQKYLAQEFDVSMAPSAAYFVATADNSARFDRPPVAIGFGEALPSEGLPAIPEAEREAESVRRFFPQASVLTGRDATIERVLQALKGADILHFAGHALANQEHPQRSKLVLSDGHGGAQALTAARLSQLGTRLRLAVLSACGSLDGPLDDAEGPLTLARALLVAGTGQVVAARWDLDDRRAHQIVAWFYQELSRGVDPVKSLAVSVRRAIDSGEFLPADWSQWAVIGAPAHSATYR